MPRNISFSLTKRQFVRGLKDITRRMGWADLEPGDKLWAVEKCMGLKRGEKIKRLGLIEVISVRREPLNDITLDDVRREGFPGMRPWEFVVFFCESHKGCRASTIVTRIEYRKLGKNKCRSKSMPRSSSLAAA